MRGDSKPVALPAPPTPGALAGPSHRSPLSGRAWLSSLLTESSEGRARWPRPWLGCLGLCRTTGPGRDGDGLGLQDSRQSRLNCGGGVEGSTAAGTAGTLHVPVLHLPTPRPTPSASSLPWEVHPSRLSACSLSFLASAPCKPWFGHVCNTCIN